MGNETPVVCAGIPKVPKTEIQSTRTSLKSATAPKLSGSWNLQLPPVPGGILLPRTSCTVNVNEISQEALMENIEKCSVLLSLKVKYLSEPASVALLSQEYISMRLSIWNTGDHEATVEIWALYGDSSIFEDYAYKLLSAANGELPEILHEETDISQLMIAQQKRHDQMLCLMPHGRGYLLQPIDSVRAVYGCLKGTNLCEQGLERMLCCCNPRKTRIGVPVLFCRVVLMGMIAPGSKSEEAKEMQGQILSIIQHQGVRGMAPADAWDTHSDRDGFTPSVLSTHVNLALSVLDRCLEVATTLEPCELEIGTLTRETLVDNFLSHARVSTSVDLIETLLLQLGNAHNNAHIARVAASCLRRMCLVSQGALQQTQSLTSQAMLEAAHQIGKSSHAKLEWECEQLQAVLEPSR